MANDYQRSPAVPVFLQEIKNITESEKIGDDQFAQTFFTLPNGGKVNRILVVGTLTECENIGTDEPYMRGHLVDPTGSLSIYAGKYQEEAAQIMQETETPAHVAVIGKPRMYTPDSGQTVISIQPESVTVVSDVERDLWIQEAAKSTLARLAELEPSDERSAYATAVVSALESI